MPTLHFLAFTLMCSLSLLSAVHSMQCTKTQYSWPRERPKFCCDRCPPGEHMIRRSPTVCEIECKACEQNHYKDTYNMEMSCDFCRTCDELYMEYETQCNGTHDAVCRCKAGYRCKDQDCTECVQIPTTTITSTLPPPSTTTMKPTTGTTLDIVWVLVVVVLLCAAVTFFVVANILSLQRWIRNKLGYFLAQKPAPLSTTSEEEEVSKPIQEACGKCDHLLDV